jgi:hypothetical protein
LPTSGLEEQADLEARCNGMTLVEQIKDLLSDCSEEQRRQIFDLLRKEFHIHPLEAKWNTTAEVILDAIDRAPDLTQRGVRGVIAEAAFKYYVIPHLEGWVSEDLLGDLPYDFLMQDSAGGIRVQVKMQRLKKHVPMTAKQGYRRLPADMYVVETQRTRGGIDPQTGEDTRPYRFGEFDLLAVSMHPSTNDWSSFMFTVADWLLPRPENERLMLKFQPVAKAPNEVWTNNFESAAMWLRSGAKKKLV